MEKITGKQVESMMEAYASVYNNQEQQTLSEMHEHAAMEGEYVDENVLNYLGDKFKKGADQIKGFFAPGSGVNPNSCLLYTSDAADD